MLNLPSCHISSSRRITLLAACLIFLSFIFFDQPPNSSHDVLATDPKTITAHPIQALQTLLQTLFPPRPQKPFLPSSFYETDHNGAIEIFEKHGVTLCRIYRVCRLKNANLQLPLWMKNHSTLLGAKCGLSSLQFSAPWTLKSRFGIPPYYDWLAPDLPTHALLKFSKSPLSSFFASRTANASLLESKSSTEKVSRKCFSPFSCTPAENSSRICSSRPEGRIANPAFLVNMHPHEPKADNDYQTLLSTTYTRLYATEVDIFEPSSGLMRNSKACFRSVITAPGLTLASDRSLKTSNDAAEPNSINASEIASLLKETVDPVQSKPASISKYTSANQKQVVPNKDRKRAKRKAATAVGNLVRNKTLTVTHNSTDPNAGTKRSRSASEKETFTEKESTNKKGLRKRAVQNYQAPTIPRDVFLLQGGIELFTHRAVAGKAWNSSSDIDPIKNIYGVCRIHKACRYRNQTILLPDWMEEYAQDLESHCGLSSISYIPSKIFDAFYSKLQSGSKLNSGVFAMNGFGGNQNFEIDLDLMGSRIYRSQEQHFMTDFFHDGIHAFDALFNQQRGRHSIFKRQCLYKRDSVVGKEVIDNRECVNVRTETKSLNPAVLVHDRIKKKNPSSKYIKEVLAMMGPTDERSTNIIYESNLSSTGPHNSTCFRSIVFTRNSYPPRSVLEDSDRNVFFRVNNISRKSVWHSDGRETGNRNCEVHLTLLKPPKLNRSFRQKRKRKLQLRVPFWEIQNQEEVLAAVKLSAAKLGTNLTIIVNKFRHGSKSASPAKKIVQNSEIVLGVNNPAMTSIVFARPRTSVIEIQPFGYSTGPYRSFARSLHLKYRSLTAMPDVERFSNCVRENYLEDWEAGTELVVVTRARDDLIELFREASENFNGKESRLELARRHNRDGGLRKGRIPLERVCARSQRIYVNASLVSDMIIEDAKEYCKQRDRASKDPSTVRMSGMEI